MRVSAAGLGGVVCFHAHSDVVDELRDWLRQTLAWNIRELNQGSGSSPLSPTSI